MKLAGLVTIRQKIIAITMATASVVFLAALILFVVYDVVQYRKSLVSSVEALAKMTGYHNSAALEFHDSSAAVISLKSLSAEPIIASAVIFDGAGQMFAEFKAREASVLPTLQEFGDKHYFFKGQYFLFRQSIVQNGEVLGSIAFRIDLQPFYRSLWVTAGIGGVFLVLALIGSFLLAWWLQRLVTAPIEDLVEVSKTISTTRNYALRVTRISKDEIGLLADRFNDMLCQIEARDKELLVHRENLEEQVRERTVLLEEQKQELESTNFVVTLLQQVASAANESGEFSTTCERVLNILLASIGGGFGRVSLIKHTQHGAAEAQPTWVTVLGDDVSSEAETFRNNTPSNTIPTPSITVPILADGRSTAMLELYNLPEGTCSIKYEGLYRQVAGQLAWVLERELAEGERQRLQEQLMDASRQAGMAEVATGVLHNVGNVLNSVNVSAEVITSKLLHSKLSGLEKVRDLLEQEKANLAQFFAQPGKTEQMVSYLQKITEQLQYERSTIQTELAELVKSINHIKDTVARQQSQAKLAGVHTETTLSELIEEALAFNEQTLLRHNIEIVRAYTETEPLLLEKHKVHQILVNLITNAKHAIGDQNSSKKQLILRSGLDEYSHPFIEVEDSGIGIPSENLTKIFFYGFTTKKDGHGFGLHSSALAAKEIGATLTAASDGIGTGARFRLTISDPKKVQPKGTPKCSPVM